MSRRDGSTTVEGLNLKQVAARLGVHYMTAYRYVRTGRLPAVRVGSGWVVTEADLDAFAAAPALPSAAEGTDWRGRVRESLLAGDEIAAWRTIEQALLSGRTPTDCYLDLVAGALADIGDASAAASTGAGDDEPDDPAGPYVALTTARRLVAQLGARFRRPGRRRGTVVFGAPAGELHDLPIAIVADLVRLEGFTCLELGADVPAAAFAAALRRTADVVAVGIGVTGVEHLEAVAATVAAARAVDPDVPVVLGGQGVRNGEVAELLGATAWAPDGAGAVALIGELATRRPAADRRAPPAAAGHA